MPVLRQRIGKERIYAEAVESHIGGWFWNAAARARDPAGRPARVRLRAADRPTKPPGSSRPRSRCSRSPRSSTGRRSRCRRPEAEVPEELVDAGARGAARDRSPSSCPPRTARRSEGDTLVVDLVSPDGEAQRDTSSSSAPGGSSRRSRRRSSARQRRRDEDGRPTSSPTTSTATVDDHASRRSRRRCCRSSTTSSRAPPASSTRSPSCAPTSSAVCASSSRSEIEDAFRAAAVDALVEASNVQAAGPLVETRTRELLDGFVRSLERRGIAPETYFQVTGQHRRAARPRRCAPRRASRSRASSRSRRSPTSSASRSPTTRSRQLIREQAEAAGEDADAGDRGRLGARPPRSAARGPAAARGARPARRRGQADPGRAARRPAKRSGRPTRKSPSRETKLWTPGSKEPA